MKATFEIFMTKAPDDLAKLKVETRLIAANQQRENESTGFASFPVTLPVRTINDLNDLEQIILNDGHRLCLVSYWFVIFVT